MAKRRSSKSTARAERPAARPASRVPAAGIDPARALAIADAMVEAGCLTAAAILPLYFSLLTTTVWETDKAGTLIALAMIVAGGLLARVFFGGLPSLPAVRSSPLVWAALAVFVVYALGTALSISPQTSFYGSLERHQGLLTHAGYLVFFLAAMTTMRSRAPIDRLMTVLIFTSLLPVVYGLLQQIGYDPLPAGGDPAVTLWPVRSSFGDHIFFGAYLVLLIPLTAARVLKLAQPESEPTERSSVDHFLIAGTIVLFAAAGYIGLLAMVSHIPSLSALFPLLLGGYALLGLALEALPRSRAMHRMRLWGYGTLLALQVVALLVTSARGPWFGAFGTIPIVGLLLAYRLNRPRLWWSALGITVAGALFLIVLNIDHGPLQPLRTVRGLDHIANITGSDSSDTSVRGRLQVWKGVSTLLIKHPAIGSTWGGLGRDIAGYGPDTLRFAFEAVYPLKLRQDTVETYTLDRSHDIYLDTLVDAGLLGFLALLAAAVFFFRRTIGHFMTARATAEGRTASWLLIGMVAAVAGHLVEGVFGIETAVTLLIFWLLLGTAAGWLQSQSIDGKASGPDVEGQNTGGRSIKLPVFILWGAAIVLAGTFLVTSPGVDHPGLFATLWLLGLIAAVGVIAYAVTPVGPGKRTRPAVAPPPTTRPALRIRIGAAVLGLVVLAVLVSQWRFQSAAIANTAGSTNFAQGNLTGGLGDAQQAARYAPYVATYGEDLGTAYLSLARMRINSAEPTYRPGGDDARTIDPGRALTLGKGQLTELGLMSLHGAHSASPLDPSVDEALGNAYLGMHQTRPAIVSFKDAEFLSHNNPRYYDDEAQAQLAAGNAQEAQVLATKAIRLDRKYWYSHYTLAQAEHKAGKRLAARAQARLAVFWAPIAYPPPPGTSLSDMKKLARTG